jgi:hypothetical protein
MIGKHVLEFSPKDMGDPDISARNRAIVSVMHAGAGSKPVFAGEITVVPLDDGGLVVSQEITGTSTGLPHFADVRVDSNGVRGAMHKRGEGTYMDPLSLKTSGRYLLAGAKAIENVEIRFPIHHTIKTV